VNSLNPGIVNPAYVQIGKKEAAAILGVSVSKFDQMRKEDPECPKGFTRGDQHNSPLFFRLSDMYTYSEALMQQSVPVDQADVANK